MEMLWITLSSPHRTVSPKELQDEVSMGAPIRGGKSLPIKKPKVSTESEEEEKTSDSCVLERVGKTASRMTL